MNNRNSMSRSLRWRSGLMTSINLRYQTSNCANSWTSFQNKCRSFFTASQSRSGLTALRAWKNTSPEPFTTYLRTQGNDERPCTDCSKSTRSGRKMEKKRKKQLHYSLVRGCKIKRAVEQALNLRVHTPINLSDPSFNRPRLVTGPSDVRRVFSECFEHLGGDPTFQANDEILTSFLQHVPKCAPGTYL